MNTDVAGPCARLHYTHPIIDYAHDINGIGVIDGYVYRGRAVRDLKVSMCSVIALVRRPATSPGRIFTLSYRRGVVSGFTDITSQLFPTRVGGYTLSGVTSFGEDDNGELYIATVGADQEFAQGIQYCAKARCGCGGGG